jgi:hypothetical protein
MAGSVEASVDAVPDHVVAAVAAAVSPAELGDHLSVTSELVHRVMAVTYHAATCGDGGAPRVEWNPEGDVWKPGIVLGVHWVGPQPDEDTLVLVLDDGDEQLAVMRRHVRPVPADGAGA